MSDRAFTGRDVAEAVAMASRELGVPAAALRYVVLDPGQPGRIGLQPSPARIAVLMGGAAPPSGPPSSGSVEDPAEGVRKVMGAIVEAAGLDVRVEIVPVDEGLEVRLSGSDRSFFYGEGGEVLRATEHLLQRACGQARPDGRVSVSCEGYREWREETLGAEARGLAEAVRASGEARVTRPLNSYERRIVHMALAGEEGVTTFSVGEGEDRRVTVALRGAGAGDGGGD